MSDPYELPDGRIVDFDRISGEVEKVPLRCRIFKHRWRDFPPLGEPVGSSRVIVRGELKPDKPMEWCRRCHWLKNKEAANEPRSKI